MANTGPVPTREHVYILVHPERWISSDPFVLFPESFDEDEELAWAESVNFTQLDHAQAEEVTRVSALCGRRIVVDDGDIQADIDDFGLEDVELMPGVGMDGWELVNAAPEDLDNLADLLPSGTKVFLAGYARQDCVAKVARILTAAGCSVSLHEHATLPATVKTLPWWRSKGLVRVQVTKRPGQGTTHAL